MDKVNYEEMWEIMREHDLEAVNAVHEDLKCIICKKIMINAFTEFCGCHFCKDCITNYLRTGPRKCPGVSSCCGLEIIDINHGVKVNEMINRRISKVNVICPNNDCQSEMEMKSLGNHLRICIKQPEKCPYFDVGCEKDKISSSKIDDHMLRYGSSHAKLLINWINNSQNEMDSLKREISKIKDENVQLKDKIKTYSNISTLLEDLQSNYRQSNLEIERLTKEILILKEYRESTCPPCQKQMDLQNQEINNLKKQSQSNEIIINNICSKMKNDKNMKQEILLLSQTNEILDLKMQEHKKSLDNITITTINLRGKCTHLQTLLYKNSEFIWKIDNWNLKMKQAQEDENSDIFYSGAFYSHPNGYKMYLSVWPDGMDIGKYTHLSVGFYLMKGPFDDILQWPFSHDVELSVIDQLTGLAHVTHTTKCFNYPDHLALQKPKNATQNYGIIMNQFLELGQFVTHRSLCDSNQIFIKCLVKINENF